MTILDLFVHLQPFSPPPQRIHRLGQTKKVHVVKYAFSDTYEENILKIHKNIAAGQLSISGGNISAEGVRVLTKGLL